MYHICKSKSKVKPFTVVLLAQNGEVLSSHSLKTKQACFKNISAACMAIGATGTMVQDDTVHEPDLYNVFAFGTKEKTGKSSSPRYKSGKNPKKDIGRR